MDDAKVPVVCRVVDLKVDGSVRVPVGLMEDSDESVCVVPSQLPGGLADKQLGSGGLDDALERNAKVTGVLGISNGTLNQSNINTTTTRRHYRDTIAPNRHSNGTSG